VGTVNRVREYFQVAYAKYAEMWFEVRMTGNTFYRNFMSHSDTDICLQSLTIDLVCVNDTLSLENQDSRMKADEYQTCGPHG